MLQAGEAAGPWELPPPLGSQPAEAKGVLLPLGTRQREPGLGCAALGEAVRRRRAASSPCISPTPLQACPAPAIMGRSQDYPKAGAVAAQEDRWSAIGLSCPEMAGQERGPNRPGM